MDATLRRQLWVLDLVFVAVIAVLAAHAAATVIAAALPARPMATPRPMQVHPLPLPAPKSVEGIVGRNIFCSACDEAPAPSEVTSSRALTLLAIMFAPPPSDPRWSVAVVRDDEAAAVGPFGVGDTLGGATIVAIEATRVVLDAGHGRRELLELFHGGARSAFTPVRGPAGPFFDAVTKTGGHSYEVQRIAVERRRRSPAGGERPVDRDAGRGARRLFVAAHGEPRPAGRRPWRR